jgi:heme/copper-type cytochrome/quinol oxidase subunit 2
MEKCPYCSTPVDRQAAAAAAESQSKVNQACSDASYLRIAAVVMWVLLGLSFIPLLPLVRLGSEITFVVVLVMIIRWQVKFGGIRTNDPDYPQAKRNRNLALVLWLAAFVGFVVRQLLTAIIFT